MKTILKKSLAMAVCVALCLTAFIGCLTVSATGTATAVISTANVANGTASTNLTVTISGSPNIVGARFDIVADATKLTLGTVADGADFDVETSTPATNATRFVVTANDLSTGLASIEITLPYTIVNPTTAGTISVEFGTTLEVAEVGETLMTVTPTNGAVVVAAAHVHDFSGAWQTSATQHWNVCPTDSAIGNLADHSWGEWVTDTAATCTATGTKHRTCSVCGYVENGTIAIDSTNHDYVAGTPVAATCGAAGYTRYTCSRCGDYYDVAGDPATGAHTWNYTSNSNGTHDGACTVCDAVIDDEACDFGEWQTVTPATCGADGTKSRTCSKCGYVENGVIPATGEHTWGEWVSDAEGHSRTCTVCGAVDAGEHDGDPCSVCGYTAPSAEPVLDNNLVFANVSAGLASTSVQFSFRIRQDKFTSYADFDMVLIPGKYDTTDFDLVEEVTPIVINKADFTRPNATFYNYTYTDLQLYELGLDIHYYIKAYDAKGDYVAHSAEFVTSPATSLKSQISTTGNAKMKTAMVDLLVVSDEAAQLFSANYPESDLANATSVLEGVDLSVATATTPALNVVDEFNATNANFGTATSSTYRVMMSASVQKVPVLTYRLGDKSANRIDTANLSMTISYTSIDGSEHSTTVSGEDWVRSGNFISYNYADIGLHDSATTITAVATYNGDVAFTKTYTVETFLNNNLANATLGDMMASLAKFGSSFRTLMGY